MKYSIDINCDVGEGLGNEELIMPYISSCSIACGGHAGDTKTIVDTIKLATKYSIKIGAHPSFPDKENFGRTIIDMPLKELQLSIESQILKIRRALEKMGTKLHHVKPHGALYNLAAIDSKVAQLIIDAIKNTTENVFLYVPYKSVIEKLALKNDLKIKIEAFADRNYNADLSLVSRKKANALIIDSDELVKHLLKMIIEQKVVSVNGGEVEIKADTFCVHGDNPNAVKLLKYMSKVCNEKGIKFR